MRWIVGCRARWAFVALICLGRASAHGDDSAPARFVVPAARASEPGHLPPAPSPPSAAEHSQLQMRGGSTVRRPEPAVFNGVQLGVSTRADVEKAWGTPLEVFHKNAVAQHVYDMKPFDRVEVTLLKDRVVSIAIHLQQEFTPETLAQELGLAEFTPVKVSNEAGTVVGLSFPERGVAFSLQQKAQGTPQVSQIVLDTLEAEPFVLRAESRLSHDYGGCLDDLDQALGLNPHCAQAQALRARVLNNLGRYQDALTAATAATQAEPENQAYQLIRAAVLVELGRYDEAVALTQKAADASDAHSETKAQAMYQLGDLTAAGPKHDYKQAMEYHLQALKLAQSLLTDRRLARRQAARNVMIDAHLAVSADIAFGYWKSRSTIVPKWLDRAAFVAQQTASSVGASPVDDALRINGRALTACVGLEGQVDPTPWADRLLEAAEKKLQTTTDPLFRQHVQWELGCGMYDAMQACVDRSKFHEALKYGKLAVSNLEQAATGRQATPAESYLLGRLYFRMGSIYAVQQKDHAAAVVWFDKAVPLLSEAPPSRAMGNLGRAGETLVSIAVSYWSVGDQEKALTLTQRGLEWMQQAVEQRMLDEPALAVPYSNLAAMHRYLGQKQQADGYQELAAKVDPQRAR